jgi:hypothetical protein
MYGKDRPAIPGLPITVHLNERGNEHTKGSMLFDFPNFGSKYGSPATIVTSNIEESISNQSKTEKIKSNFKLNNKSRAELVGIDINQ